MASLKASADGGLSEEVSDTLCTSCQKSSRTASADKLCLDCSRYLCAQCLQSHNYIFHDDHELLDMSQFTGQEEVILLTEKCDRHRGEVLKLWCRNHGNVACVTCVATDHRSCPAVHYIPDILPEIYKEEDVEDTKVTMVNILRDIIEKKVASDKDVGKDADVLATSLQDIGDLEKKLIQIVKDVIKEEREKLQTTHGELTVLNDEERVMEDKLKATVERSLRSIEQAGQNVAQRFVALKKCQKQITAAKEAGKLKLSMQQQRQMLLPPDKSGILGKIIDKIKVAIEDMKTEDQNSMQAEYQNPTNSTSTYSKTSYHLDIALTSETACNSLHLCVLQNGLLLIGDCNNKRLKLCDPDQNVLLSYCDLIAGPVAVCQISEVEAVTSLNNYSLQFVALTGNEVQPTRTIQMKEPMHDCVGLVYHDGRLFISSISDSKIYVKDLTGRNLKVFDRDQHGENLFQDLRHLAISEDGRKLYAADKGVTCISSEGRLLYRTVQTGLSQVGGLSLDGSGGLYLCGVFGYGVTHIDDQGENLRTILDVVHEGFLTRGVVFDSKTKRLYVTKYFCDTITVVDLNQC